MKQFAGKTAVITGGAGGIGMALANQAADRQMNVVLADVQEDALASAVEQLEKRQCPAIGVLTDTRQKAALEELLAKSTTRFGNVHLLFNNAGVVNAGRSLPIWEMPDVDWNWVMSVNFYGVLHGIQTFLPHMVGHGEEGHVVNTASIATFIPGGGPYGVSKYGVILMSEQLAFDLEARESSIGTSVICPGWVNTGIGDAERNRPEELRSKNDPEASGLGINELLSGSKSPDELASAVFSAVERDQFYIFPHSGWDYLLRERTEAMLARGGPHRFDMAAHIATRAAGEDI